VINNRKFYMQVALSIYKMILRFDPLITEQQVYAQGIELAQIMGLDKGKDGKRVVSHPDSAERYVATIANPVLVTDNYKISGIPDSILRDTLFALFGSPHKVVEYGGTSVDFDQRNYPGVWSPSIDTLLFCRALNSYDFSGMKKAVEIGTGSGFISKHLLRIAPGLEKITLVDLNPKAIDCAKDNIKDSRADYVAEDALDYIEGQSYDLIICNPPYIPRPVSIDDNPYEGVNLLNQLISRSREYLNPGGSFITNISSLCRYLTDRTISEAGVRSADMDSMTVPLKVFNVLNNPEWMDYLIREKGLQENEHDGYKYWHTITITEIRPE
jgi:release factor glutamine methyltransferase